MMMNQAGPNAEPSPIQALASQLRLTRGDTEFVINIVKHNDPPLEWLKDPKVLHIIKQRKGRWVKEEEEFANFLNHEFCLGLSEIANGTTKRAFLSSKLSCTKMRISKKFKGQNTGKEVFDCKTNEFPPLEINYYKQRHIELEKKFIRSVLKSEINGSVKNSQKKNPSSHPSSPSRLLQSTSTGMKLLPTTTNTVTLPTIFSGYISNGVRMPTPNNHDHGRLNPDNHLMMMNSGSAPAQPDQHVRRVSAHMNAPLITCHSPSRSGVQYSISAHQDADFLSPSFTNQFQSMSTNCPTYTMNSACPPQSMHHQALADDRLNTWLRSRDECYNTAEVSKKRRLDDDSGGGQQFKPIPAVPVSQDGTSASGSSQSDDRMKLTSPTEASSNIIGISSHRVSMVKSESNCSVNDIPDLLVGFDKHVAAMKMTTTEQSTVAAKHRPIPEDSHFFAGADCGESPYITSKSFDELHKYLGKGLSSDKMPHLDLNDQYQSAGWPVGVYCAPKPNGGYQPSAGGFLSIAHNQPGMDAPSEYLYRPSSTSNCSDLTCSD